MPYVEHPWQCVEKKLCLNICVRFINKLLRFSKYDFRRQQLDWAFKANGKPLCVRMWAALAFSETRKLFIVRQCCQLGCFHMEYMGFWAQRNSFPRTEGKEPTWHFHSTGINLFSWYLRAFSFDRNLRYVVGADYSSDCNPLSEFNLKMFHLPTSDCSNVSSMHF